MIYPFVLPLYRRTDSKLGHFILLKRLEDASESERAWSGICNVKKKITKQLRNNKIEDIEFNRYENFLDELLSLF